MAKTNIVRARARHGTRSLDLTIPTAVSQEYGIHEGDAFVVSITRNGDISLHYKRLLKDG